MLFSGDCFKGIMLSDEDENVIAQEVWNALGLWRHSKLPQDHEIIGFEAQASGLCIKSLKFITWRPRAGWEVKKKVTKKKNK